jgi:hypothetical protein
MIHDLIAAIREGLREYKRLRWKKQRARQVVLPF